MICVENEARTNGNGVAVVQGIQWRVEGTNLEEKESRKGPEFKGVKVGTVDLVSLKSFLTEDEVTTFGKGSSQRENFLITIWLLIMKKIIANNVWALLKIIVKKSLLCVKRC